MQPSESIIKSELAFLKQFPPFSFIDEPQLSNLVKASTLRLYEQGDVVFEEKNKPFPYFFVIKKGAVKLTQQQNGENILIDECDEGDTFGVRALFAADTYLSTAVAAEQSLIYQIPVEVANSILQENARVAMFFAAGFAAGLSAHNQAFPSENAQKARRFLAQPVPGRVSRIGLDSIKVPTDRVLISCSEDCTILETARRMKTARVGSMLITNEQGHPTGILTDTDLRNRVVANGLTELNLPITSIMSSPVLTIPPDLSLIEVMLRMTTHQVTHLCITTDGTPHSVAVGMVSQRDVLLAQGNNPALLAKYIRAAKSPEEIASWRARADYLLEHYLEQELAIHFVASVMTEINDAVIKRLVELAIEQLAKQGKPQPKSRFCWLSLGSEGRCEQLLRTDQDNALVYEDPPTNVKESTQQYYLEMAHLVNKYLEICGFEPCPANMMASNPQWCMPLSGWKNRFAGWIKAPDNQALMHATIFFDFRPVMGESLLAQELTRFIHRQMDSQSVFLAFMAKNALQSLPPLSFFKSMIVEKSGEHKDRFDIKARAMMPLADAARVFALEHRLNTYTSTAGRFEAIAKISPGLREIAEASAMAYEILMRYRAVQGFANKDSGRYIQPDSLNKLERQILRNTFQTIARLQELMQVRYQLSYLRE